MSAASVDSNPPLWIALDSSQEDLASILVRLVLLLKDLKNIGLGLKDEWLGNCLFSRNGFFCNAFVVMKLICHRELTFLYHFQIPCHLIYSYFKTKSLLELAKPLFGIRHLIR